MNKGWVGTEKRKGGNMLQQWHKQALYNCVVRERDFV